MIRFAMCFLAIIALLQSQIVYSKEIDNIRDAHLRWRRAIQSMQFKATLRGVNTLGFGDTQIARHKVAISGDRRRVEAQHLLPLLDWEHDVTWSVTILTSDKVEVLWVLNRALQIAKKNQNSAHIQKLFPYWWEPYMECSGWWPEDKSILGHPKMVSDVAPEAAVHVVLGNPDLVVELFTRKNDTLCTYVKMAKDGVIDELWFDSERNGLLVHRIRTINGARSFEYENSDFREMSAGVWLPWKTSRTESSGGQVISQYVRSIEAMSINDVNDRDFEFDRKEGMVIIDELHDHSMEVISGGLDLLEPLCDVVCSYSKAQNVALRQMKGSILEAMCFLAGFMVGGFFSVCLAAFNLRNSNA